MRVLAKTGEKFNGYCRFKKLFHRLANIATIFQERIDRTLGYSTPAWLGDIIIVPRSTSGEQTRTREEV